MSQILNETNPVHDLKNNLLNKKQFRKFFAAILFAALFSAPLFAQQMNIHPGPFQPTECFFETIQIPRMV